jgi:hypothetical protein
VFFSTFDVHQLVAVCVVSALSVFVLVRQARSVSLTAVAGSPALFVGLGDGRLLTFSLDSGTAAAEGAASTDAMDEDAAVAVSGSRAAAVAVGARKELCLGTTPVLLTRFRQAPPAKRQHAGRPTGRPAAATAAGGSSSSFSSFSSGGAVAVFAACDRPAVVYGQGGRVRLSAVACGGGVAHAAPFHAQAFPHGLALAIERAKPTKASATTSGSSSGSSGGGGAMAEEDGGSGGGDGDEEEEDGSESLVIGALEATQRLHVRRVGLNGWQPRRVCHLPLSKYIAVACCFAPPGGEPLPNSAF